MFKTYMKVPRYRLYLQEGSFYVIYILLKKRANLNVQIHIVAFRNNFLEFHDYLTRNMRMK